MEVSAKLRFLRMSPQKVRLVVDIVRGLPVERAEHQLLFSRKGASQPVIKLLKSAIANAENNFKLNKDNLFIKKITVDEGPTLKRWRARAFGRAGMIRKRSSHITIILDELKPGAVAKKAVKGKGTKVDDKKVAPTKPTKKIEKQPVVKYEDVKHEAKGQAEADKMPAKQKKKPFVSFKSIKDRFTRRIGE